MFGFLIGWGVFWLIVWLALFFLYYGDRTKQSETVIGGSVVGIALSLFWILAVVIGHQVNIYS